jgi:L-fuculose-phosphate aldolase
LAKGRLTPNDLVVTDLEGTVVQGSHQPSSELRIHLAAYRLRPEIGAVVHAHPKTIVALSLASIDVMFTALPETVVALGLIGSAPYETPGSSALASVMESALENHDAIVMERHGAITLGRNLFEAYDRMETLEHAAQTLYLAQSLGSIEALPDDEIERLLALAH